VKTCIYIFAQDLQEPKIAEKFVSKLVADDSIIDCYIICGKLKLAYLAAVKIGAREKVLKIRDEAKRLNSPSDLQMCENYLKK